MKKRLVIPLMLFLVALFSNAAYAGHWTVPSSSPTVMHLVGTLKIDGADALANDEVAVFDSTATLIGSFVVTDTGQYGDLVVNGDFTGTPAIREGATVGEALTIKVWSASKTREYSGSEIGLTATSAFAGFGYQAATLPLTFAGSFFGLNLTATATPKSNQTIGAISFAPATVNIGGTTTVSATATSALPVTFASTTTSVCTVSGTTVTTLTTGTCTITADQVGNGAYNAATQVTGSISPTKQNQSISAISFTPTTVSINGTTTASASATSGLGVIFSSTTPGVCTVSGAIVTALSSGICNITADQAGNGFYNAASQVTGIITPGKLSQTIGAISFAPATISIGGTTTASATATSGIAVTFTSTTPTICTVSGATVTAVTAGTCIIAADQSGNGIYGAAPQITGTISPGKLGQTIGAISFTPATVNVGGTTTVSATATSGIATTLTSTTASVCTVSGTTVTALTTGTCTIAADQAGNSTYNAATQVIGSISPTKQNQTIGAIIFTPTNVSVNGTTTASATATSGLGVIYSSTTPSVCNVSGATIIALTTGTCTIAANQTGNGAFNAASQVTGTITVSKSNQTIGAINFAPATIYIGGTTTVSATATSALPVTFASTTTSVCTVSGTTVTTLTTGTCTITADQAGSGAYNAATQVTGSISPTKQNQSISAISFTPTTVSINGTTTASASATSGLGVIFSSTTPGVCTVSGAIVTSLSSGTCSITADQAGNGFYNAASQVTGIITPGKLSQTISAISFAPATITIGGTTTVSATATSGIAVTLASTTPTICTVSGATVTAVTAGTCIIAADQSGNGIYSAAPQITGTISPGKLGQSIGAVSFTPATVNVGGTATVSATATSGIATTFTSTTATVCTVSGTTVTALTTGTCTIAADQAGNSTFNAATQVTGNITSAATVSGAPTNTTAVPGNAQAAVTFIAPAFNGGSAITGYTVTSTPAGGVDNNVGTTATTHVITGLANGTAYTFTVKAINLIGSSPASAASTSVIPNILTPSIGTPSATIAKSTAMVTYTVTYAGADAITLATGDVTINKTGNATGTATVSGSGLATRTVTISGVTGDGTIGISIAAGTATASSGSITASQSSASATFTVDNTAPTLTVDALANNTATSNNTLNITGTTNDANGVQTVIVNGNPITLTNGTFNTAVTLSTGSNTIAVIATDTAGNQSTDTRTISYDHTAPAITFASPTPADQSFTNKQTVTIAGSASKAGSVEVTVNSNTPITITTSGAENNFTTPVVLTLGLNSISIKASDTATPANTTTVKRTVTYDTSAPVLAITDPDQAVTTTYSNYLVKGTLSDNFKGSTLSFAVDGIVLTPAPTVGTDGTFQQTVSFTEGKTYHVTANATDLAGNSTTVQRNIVYRPIGLSDALRALKISMAIETYDLALGDDKLDVAPLVGGKPKPDGTVDIGDAVVLLGKTVGLVNW